MKKKQDIVSQAKKKWKTLNFKEEEARQDYPKIRPKLNVKTIELLIIRGKLLARNKQFIREWNNVSKIKETTDYDTQKKKMCETWGIQDDGLYAVSGEPDKIVKVYHGVLGAKLGRDKLKPEFCTFVVNLKYPKKRIMIELNRLLEQMIEHYQEFLSEELYRDYPEHFQKDDITRLLKKPNKLPGNILTDSKDYEKYLTIWDLKNQGKSWSAIVKRLNLDNIQAARNAHVAVNKLIRKGLPGFLPFPE